MPLFSLRVLTGPVHSGKTTFLREMIDFRKSQGARINGILSLACFERDERRGYDALDLQTGEGFPLLRTPAEEGWIRVGRYGLVPDGFRRAEAAVCGFRKSDLTVIDELGPLELIGGGFWNSLQRLRSEERAVLAVIREALLEPFAKLYGPGFKVFRLGEPGLETNLLAAEL